MNSIIAKIKVGHSKKLPMFHVKHSNDSQICSIRYFKTHIKTLKIRVFLCLLKTIQILAFNHLRVVKRFLVFFRIHDFVLK